MSLEIKYVEGSDTFNYELETLKEKGVVKAWSDYKSGDYEGSGNLIVKMEDGRYLLHNASHCSCYGPVDEFYPTHDKGYKTVAELVKNCSEELQKELAPLLKLIKGDRKTH